MKATMITWVCVFVSSHAVIDTRSTSMWCIAIRFAIAGVCLYGYALYATLEGVKGMHFLLCCRSCIACISTRFANLLHRAHSMFIYMLPAVDHSIVMYFMNKEGQFCEFFTQLAEASEISDRITAILKKAA